MIPVRTPEWACNLQVCTPSKIKRPKLSQEYIDNLRQEALRQQQSQQASKFGKQL